MILEKCAHFLYLELLSKLMKNNYHLSTFKESLVSTQEGLSRLKEDGILKEHPTGGYIIESTPKNLNFSFPLSLKDKAINLWSKEDSVWLNTLV